LIEAGATPFDDMADLIGLLDLARP
jgi:hypothetical protein